MFEFIGRSRAAGNGRWCDGRLLCVSRCGVGRDACHGGQCWLWRNSGDRWREGDGRHERDRRFDRRGWYDGNGWLDGRWRQLHDRRKTTAGGSSGTGGVGGMNLGGAGGTTGTGGTGATDGGSTKDANGRPEVSPDAIVINDSRPPAEVGTDSNGGGRDAGSYAPCPTNGDPCKILPLGDSITWGIQYDGAYRVELFTKAVAAGQNITFTGSLSNGPTTVSGKPFPQKNEGHSGWTIDQDASLIPSPALSTASGGIPHIILLHIGTNDIYAASGQSTMPDRLAHT